MSLNLELKKFKHSKLSSIESECYDADIYVNGIKAFSARNYGNGGPDIYVPYGERGTELLHEAYAYADSLPPVQHSKFDDISFPQSLDYLIGTLVADKLIWLEVSKKMRGAIMFFKGKQLYTVRYLYSERNIEKLKAREGDDIVIVNAMPCSEVVELVKENRK